MDGYAVQVTTISSFASNGQNHNNVHLHGDASLASPCSCPCRDPCFFHQPLAAAGKSAAYRHLDAKDLHQRVLDEGFDPKADVLKVKVATLSLKS